MKTQISLYNYEKVWINEVTSLMKKIQPFYNDWLTGIKIHKIIEDMTANGFYFFETVEGVDENQARGVDPDFKFYTVEDLEKFIVSTSPDDYVEVGPEQKDKFWTRYAIWRRWAKKF